MSVNTSPDASNTPSAFLPHTVLATSETAGTFAYPLQPRGRSVVDQIRHAHGYGPLAIAPLNGHAGAQVAGPGRPKLPRPTEPVPCPRCNSSDTKFCYYNNYKPEQPRYLCKACSRYWTAGGTLRNVPVGSGKRKRKLGARDGEAMLPEAGGLDHQGMASQPPQATPTGSSGTDAAGSCHSVPGPGSQRLHVARQRIPISMGSSWLPADGSSGEASLPPGSYLGALYRPVCLHLAC
ncbi:hypothetical protein WJX73_009828 [Symbiochloris irregularis]|uniref:Dof-type domain-containing protein n=1 Tax=Symbiochloris irregularis TaxID=706552 RepID=A0AAW1NNP7_9CHLO